LWGLPNVRFFGLQKGKGVDQSKVLAADVLVICVGDRMRNVSFTAFILKQLELLTRPSSIWPVFLAFWR
jgi:hypothetical protein